MPLIEKDIEIIRQICESQPESVVWVKPVWQTNPHTNHRSIIDFRFHYCNPASVQIAGTSLIGKHILADKLPDPGESQLIYNQCLQVYETNKPLEHAYFSTALDKYLIISRVKVQDGVLTTVRNRTNEYTSQMEKEQQARLLQSLVDHSPYGISLYESVRDTDGNIYDFRLKLCNKKSAEITAFSMEELYAHTVKELMAIRGHSKYFDICKAVVETGESKYLEYYSEFRKQWIGFSIVKFEDGYLLNYIDISSLKNIQEQLEASIEELKRSNTNLEEFAYAASHDLKEPIRKIQFFSALLRTQLQSFLDEKSGKNFDRLELAASRMKLLVEDLLEYSQVNQSVNLLEEVHLNDKINKVLEDLELIIHEKEAKVYIGQMPVIQANRRQMQQLFQNLISNALKYHKPGESPVLYIESQKIKGSESGFSLPEHRGGQYFYLIQIRDNGIGFEQKDAERIFNVFTRLHGNTEYKGTGVGLSIVRKVVENHNGFIQAESAPEKGATFKILLPA